MRWVSLTALFGELRAVPRQVTQPAHHRVGDEAAPEQPALEKRCEPLRVGDVGLSCREVLYGSPDQSVGAVTC